ncbi:MAG TPA: glycosyltransferase family 2 protein [Ktedonobacterales bacterium]|nr:glycosyltransferase family 2 protein [Ktedonobacterales bacterium]
MRGEVSEVVAASLDDAFWRLASGGLAALANEGNTWAASRQLEEITRLLDSEDTDTSEWHGVIARDIAALPGAVAATAGAYAALIASYRRAHASAGDRSQAAQLLEYSCDELLARLTAEPFDTPETVITLTRLSVALPAFNEEAVIAETVASCLNTLATLCPNFEVIVVDDGSLDKTGAIGDALARADASVRCVHNRPNRGYGGALRAGFDHAEGEWLFLMDSDGQFDIREIAPFLGAERDTPGVAVIGYRAHRSEGFMRKVNAWGWKMATRAVIGLRGIRDVDCAFKLFPTGAIRACALRSTGAAVSAEFLVKFQRMGVPLIQFPVTHLPRTKGSPTGARPQVIIRAFKELLALGKSLRTWQAPASGEFPPA